MMKVEDFKEYAADRQIAAANGVQLVVRTWPISSMVEFFTMDDVKGILYRGDDFGAAVAAFNEEAG